MKKIKTGISVLIVLLAVGFAAVSTTLILNGTAIFGTNEDDFDVIFTKAIIDDTDVSSTAISEDGKTLTFETSELAIKDEESILDFTVTNYSTQYDANVTMECAAEGENASEYYEITNTIPNVIEAKTSKEGTVTARLKKSSVEEIHETFICTITVTAVERDTEGKDSISWSWSDSNNNVTVDVGDVVVASGATLNESFYVIGTTENEITLLSKFNLDLTELIQKDVDFLETATEFSKTNYWKNDFSSSPHNLVEIGVPSKEHYVAYAAYMYGEKLSANGRLMYYTEANSLKGVIPDVIYGRDSISNIYEGKGYLMYWLGSAYSDEYVWYGHGLDANLGSNPYNNARAFGIRPVITISSDILE